MTRNVTKAFLLALGLLAGAEGIVRVFFVRNMSGRFDYGYHPTAGFVEKSDGRVDLVRAGGRRFRPQSFRKEPDPETLRVFVIGDSVPRGPGLDGAYAWQLAEILNERGVKTESYNLAVAGYGVHRSQVVLRQALEYRPDLIVLHVNYSNEFEDEREWKRSQEFKSWHPKNWLMKSLIVRRLYEAKTEKVFWEWLPVEIRTQQAVSDADAELRAQTDEATQREWDDRVRQYTAGGVAMCKARGVKVLLVTQAYANKQPDGTVELEGERVQSLVASFVGDGVYLVSMKDVFAGKDAAELYADGSHVRADGHKLIAEAIAGVVQRERLAK